MRTLELFAGTKSFSKVAKELGHKTFTVEISPDCEPNLCMNILDVDIHHLPTDIDVLWASPPCTTFSVAGRSSNYTDFVPNSSKAALGLAYVLKTLELIEKIKPKYFFIENPMGYLRKFPFMQKFHREHVWYCQYGDTRAKPTDIWTNCLDWKGKSCKNGGLDHERAPRGSKTGTQGLKNNRERSVIPPQLFKEIFESIEGSQ